MIIQLILELIILNLISKVDTSTPNFYILLD